MCLNISITLGEDEDEEQVESDEDEESPSDDEMDEAQQVSKAKSMAAALKSSKGARSLKHVACCSWLLRLHMPVPRNTSGVCH